MGPHKSGHLYTTNLRVTRIHFEAVSSNVPLTLVKNYAMPVSQSMPMSVPMPSPLSQPLASSQQLSQTDMLMDIGPDRSRSMAGMLPCETLKPKRRRKAVIAE